jgi:hypothetical protein
MALDVGTERKLWQRLSEAGFTVLAASNRPIALGRADQVLTLGSPDGAADEGPAAATT